MPNKASFPISDEREAEVQAAIERNSDSREASDEQLAAMRPAVEALPPALYASLTKTRGRPKAAITKVEVKLRLDQNTVDVYKATGPGWQTRINAALAKTAGKLASAPSLLTMEKTGRAESRRSAKSISKRKTASYAKIATKE